MKMIVAALVAVFAVSAMVGCRAEVEGGDTQSSVTAPR